MLVQHARDLLGFLPPDLEKEIAALGITASAGGGVTLPALAQGATTAQQQPSPDSRKKRL
jgi:hypothetical protein